MSKSESATNWVMCPYLFCLTEIDIKAQMPDTGGQVFICPECKRPSYPDPNGGLMPQQNLEEIFILIR